MAKELHEEIVIAGFGGQGIIFAGKLLAQVAMKAGKEVTYMPAYGAEVRGGTANCGVIVSDGQIACPLVNNPDSLIVMNGASLDKFGPRLKQSGLLVYNSSLIDTEPEVNGSIKVLAVPADELAVELGNKRVANMVALGAYLQKRSVFSAEAAVENLPDVLAVRYHQMLDINNSALRRGAKYASDK